MNISSPKSEITLGNFGRLTGFAACAGLGVASLRDDIIDRSPPLVAATRFPELTDAVLGGYGTLYDTSPTIAAVTGALACLYGLSDSLVSRGAMYASNRDWTANASERSRARSWRLNLLRPSETGGLSRRRRTVGALAVSGSALVMMGTSIGQEVDNGPVRSVGAVIDVMDPTGSADDRVLVFEDSEQTAMDNSQLNRREADELMHRLGQEHNLTAVPYYQELAGQIQVVDEQGRESGRNRYGIVVGLPQAVATESLGQSGQFTYIDALADVDAGTRVVIEGEERVIDGQIPREAAALGRSIVVMDAESLVEDQQELDVETAPYYGMIVDDPANVLSQQEITSVVQAEITDLGMRAAPVTQASYEANNEKFWVANGRMLILALVGVGSALNVVAQTWRARTGVEKATKQLAMLRSQGVRTSVLKKVETLRAIKTSAYSSLLAAPVAGAAIAAVNTLVEGSQAGLGVRSIAAGAWINMLVETVSARRAASSIGRKTTAEMLR